MQGHNTRQISKITSATKDRLHQVFKSDSELHAAVRSISSKLHIPEQELVVIICNG